MDIAEWLRGLDLERYEGALRANDIDAALFTTLTDDDLKELGVTSLGHRKILLNAIAILDTSSKKTAHEGAPRPEAERRQLTVFFCDLVGSTNLSTKLDPEDLGDLLRVYQNTVAGEIARFEGHVAKFMGDGVLAYFGWPRAHEDEAERAVLAGLSVIDAVARIEANDKPLACRVGIATGLVVVGDLIGEGSAQEESIAGETPNLAARLQDLAKPNQLVVGEATRELLGRRFALRSLGSAMIKGFAEPILAFMVEGEQTGIDRFEARSGPELAPMVGRDQELTLLIDRWRPAVAGEGQAILLVGESGIGKSRIARALLDAVSQEQHMHIRYQCSPYYINSPLWPAIQQVVHAARIAAGEPVGAKLDKLEALLAKAVKDVDEAAPLLAALLGIDGEERYGKIQLAAPAQRARTLDILIRQLVGLARIRPVLVVIEDVHWIDPTTLELIGRSLDAVADNRILMILTSRPDYPQELAAHPHLTQLALNRLGRAGAEAMIDRLSGSKLSRETIDTIVSRTDGVPLFVEELTKAIIEDGEIVVPASLHDLLMARLDRLGPAKEIAQVGAVIGREFSHDLLSAVAPMPEEQASIALDQLVDSGLIFRRGTPPEASYTFKHALVQDAAYESLLRSKREQIHGRIAAVLQDRFSAIIDTQPELLAYHLTEAGSTEKAIVAWLEAGENAIRRSANLEAIRHLTKGLELVDTQPRTPEQIQNELRLQLCLGRASLKTRGYAASDVERAYAQARVLCQQVGETPELHQALMGLEAYYFARAELQTAHGLAKQSLGLAEQFLEPALLLNSYQQMGSTLFHVGKLRSALPYFKKAMNLYDEHRHQTPQFSRGLHHPGVGCQCYVALTLWHLGYPDQASKIQCDALKSAHELAQPFIRAYALCFGAWIYQYLEEVQKVRDLAESAIELSAEHEFQFWLAIAKCFSGWARVSQDQSEKGIAQMQDAIASYRATGARISEAHWLALLADAFRRSGEPAKGLDVLADAFRTIERTGSKYYEPELHLLRGALLLDLRPGVSADVETCFHTAISVARCQQAKMTELRAATHLARLWRDQGKGHDARALLAPVYGWFTEGFDTHDLVEAKELLDALS